MMALGSIYQQDNILPSRIAFDSTYQRSIYSNRIAFGSTYQQANV
jgi:hypothetical protein